MRPSRSVQPVLLVLLAAFAILLVGELPRREAHGGETGAAIADEFLMVQAEGASGEQALFLVDVTSRKILVYKIDANRLMFNAYRNYKYDLALDEWPPEKGGQAAEAEALQMKKLWEQTDDYKDAKRKKEVKDVNEFVDKRLQASKGQTQLMALTPTGGGRGAGVPAHIYMIDRANKKMLVYQMSANTLRLVAVRKYEYDEQLLEFSSSGNLTSFQSYHDVKKLVEKEKEKKEKEEKKD